MSSGITAAPVALGAAAGCRGTRLQLGVRLPAGEDPAKACAGFEGHLEMLAAAPEGVSIKFRSVCSCGLRAAYGQQLG